MMRSLYSGISGLRNHQTRMDVIANNISNVNTTAFVASRVVFKDVFSQTSKFASGSSEAVGGTNPIQIGLGVSLATIDMMHSGATALARSDRSLDFAISGEGFFIVNTNNALESPILRFTRAGNFYWDNEGFLVNGDGYFVMGKMLDGAEDISDPNEAYNGEDVRADDWNGERADLELINGSAFTNIAVDDKGIITGTNENGIKVAFGYLVLGTFENTNGLEKVGNSLYRESNNSGLAKLPVAGDNGAGTIATGCLEMSNVDLATEFTDMIVTQRGFQANSRIITTSDSMLEELVNLKR
ncbi:MAG: flagellar hook-basal body complex protein [Clostridiales bacterium]|nr:flagellar hook-basal body complex protein [Clostridiales bacterium]